VYVLEKFHIWLELHIRKESTRENSEKAVIARLGSISLCPRYPLWNGWETGGFLRLFNDDDLYLADIQICRSHVSFPSGWWCRDCCGKSAQSLVWRIGWDVYSCYYFLTAAISCLSGMLYLSVVLPILGPQTAFLGLTVTVWITLVILVLLGILNWVGVSESARVSMVGAIIAFASDLAILVTVFTQISFSEFLSLFPQMFSGKALTPITLLVSFAGSLLAFSGLESISQLSADMKLPRRRVGKMALFLVILTVGLTSP